jgi:capsid protein
VPGSELISAGIVGLVAKGAVHERIAEVWEAALAEWSAASAVAGQRRVVVVVGAVFG